MSSCLRLCEIELIVFGAFPEFVALMRVFIIRSLYLVGCWGRSLANTSIVGILVVACLEWSGYQPGALATWVQIPATPPQTQEVPARAGKECV